MDLLWYWQDKIDDQNKLELKFDSNQIKTFIELQSDNEKIDQFLLELQTCFNKEFKNIPLNVLCKILNDCFGMFASHEYKIDAFKYKKSNLIDYILYFVCLELSEK